MVYSGSARASVEGVGVVRWNGHLPVPIKFLKYSGVGKTWRLASDWQLASCLGRG